MIVDKKMRMPPIEILYFGPHVGHVLGCILEPFLSLYIIHAAMTAYEIYKETVQSFSLERKSDNCYRTLDP